MNGNVQMDVLKTPLIKVQENVSNVGLSLTSNALIV